MLLQAVENVAMTGVHGGCIRRAGANLSWLIWLWGAAWRRHRRVEDSSTGVCIWDCAVAVQGKSELLQNFLANY